MSKRIIKEIVSANRGQDVLAILHDGSIHSCTEHYDAGMKVVVGADWEELQRALPAEMARVAEERERRRKILD